MLGNKQVGSAKTDDRLRCKKTDKKMNFRFYGFILTIVTTVVRGASELAPGECASKVVSSCPEYSICLVSTDLELHPGKRTRIVYNIRFLLGETLDTTVVVATPDSTVVIMGTSLSQENTIQMTNNTYTPVARNIQHVIITTSGTYFLDTVNCNAAGNTICTTCLATLSVEYALFNVTDVPTDSTRTVSVTLNSRTVTLNASVKLVLKTTLVVTSKEADLLTDFPVAPVDFPVGSDEYFSLEARLPYPLSHYRVMMRCGSKNVKILDSRISSVGKHFHNIISIPKEPGNDSMICLTGPDLSITNLGFVPNFGNKVYRVHESVPVYGAFDDSADPVDDSVKFGMAFLLLDKSIVGQTYSLEFELEINGVIVKRLTRYFNVVERVLRNIIIKEDQESTSLRINGMGKLTFTLDVPTFSDGRYGISVSTRKVSGPGDDGLAILAIDLAENGKNLQCLNPGLDHWKHHTSVDLTVTNAPIALSDPTASAFGYAVYVSAPWDSAVEPNSIHEVTANFSYPGDRMEVFQFYYGILDVEQFTSPGAVDMSFYEPDKSIVQTTRLTLTLRPSAVAHGRVYVELPSSTSSLTESPFLLCSYDRGSVGYDIFGDFYSNISTRADGKIERVLVEISPLSVVPMKEILDNKVFMEMVVTFKDSSPLVPGSKFTVRLTSNNKTVGLLSFDKPKVRVYTNYITMTAITKDPAVTADNLTFYYSRNGTYYYQEEVVWVNNEHVFELPRVISHFYFTTDPCTVISDVTPVWKPLTSYIQVEKDKDNQMLQKIAVIMDTESDTCMDLPKPGDSPSSLWLRIVDLSLFGVTSQTFVVSVLGDGLECERVGQKILMVGVSGPSTNTRCSVDSDLVFCHLVSNTTFNTLTQCDLQCECQSLSECTVVQIVLKSKNNDDWSLCEITINDV